MNKNLKSCWASEPDKDDYVAAKQFLSLLFTEKKATKLIGKLKKGAAVTFIAKDIFRASRMPLLDISNAQVKTDHKKIVAGKKLSPLLLIRHGSTAQTIIADGYHRLCAAYSLDEDAPIPCRIV